MKIRIRFTKLGDLRYIGHLDVMRYFQKALRRAGIDMSYSQGFNPHPIMSFASPLGLGYTSVGEYFDIELNSAVSSADIKNRLNSVMTEGFEIISVRKIPDDSKMNAMASLYAACYEIKTADALKIDEQKFSEFYTQSEIIVHKETKRSEADVNIRPMILSYEFAGGALYLILSAGSRANLKPESVMDAYYSYCDREICTEDEFNKGNVDIIRLDMFTYDGDNLVRMDQIGEEF